MQSVIARLGSQASGLYAVKVNPAIGRRQYQVTGRFRLYGMDGVVGRAGFDGGSRHPMERHLAMGGFCLQKPRTVDRMNLNVVVGRL